MDVARNEVYLTHRRGGFDETGTAQGPTMSVPVERNEGDDALRQTAELVLAGLLHDIGKVFQRADWPLSQTAEKLVEDLCPVVDGRAVHRHVLWTYDFCNDNLKWLAEHVDLARVMRLATGHHRAGPADAQAAAFDAANRLAAGATGSRQIEVEELQPVIPPQVPLESILWRLGARPEAGPQVSRTSAAREMEPPAGEGAVAPVEAGPAAPEGGPPPTEAGGGQAAEQAEGPGAIDSGTSGEERQTPEATEGSAPESEAEGRQTAEGSEATEREGAGTAAIPRREGRGRVGYVKVQLLRADEEVLPQANRPEMNEQDYRALGTDLVAAVQKIGRMNVRPRVEWLVETLHGVLERRGSLVPQYVGAGGRHVSLFGHGTAVAALAAALDNWQRKGGGMGEGQPALSLTAVEVVGIEEFLSRPAVSENSTRVYHGRAVFVRLVTRLLSDLLLRRLGLLSVNRLWEGDSGFVILADGHEATREAIRRFAAEQGRQLFEQTGGRLALAASEPVALSAEQLAGEGWSAALGRLQAGLEAVKARPGADILQNENAWREEAAVLALRDRRGQPQEAGEWARLQEAYERHLGSGLARGRAIAAYNSPVTPTGEEGEPTAVGPWFVHVASSPEGLVGWEGLEAIYSVGEADEPWAWVPAWRGLPHGPTFRRADESQLRADPSPEVRRMGAVPRRRETAIGFEELGWLSRRSRKGRGFVGRSWLGCLELEAEGIRADGTQIARQCGGLAESVEGAHQGQWFWQEFLEGQLRRADRATWRVFVLRCGAGRAVLIGPWNTLTVLAGRAEQWWRRWVGSLEAWPMYGSIALGPRDVPAWQLAWRASDGLIAARQSAEGGPAGGRPARRRTAGAVDGGAGRIELLGKTRTWAGYREALRLAAMLDEQIQSPELLADEAGLTFLRRLLAAGEPARREAAWRSRLAAETRQLLLRRLPRRGQRTAGQEDLVGRLQGMIMTGKRGRLSASAALAAQMALWQNQGETS